MERSVARIAPTDMLAKTEFCCWSEKWCTVRNTRGIAAMVRYNTAQENDTQRLKKNTTGSVTRRGNGRYREMLIIFVSDDRSSSDFTFHRIRWGFLCDGSFNEYLDVPAGISTKK